MQPVWYKNKKTRWHYPFLCSARYSIAMALLKMLEEFIEQVVVDHFLTKKQQEELMIEVFEELWFVEDSTDPIKRNNADSLHDKFFHTNFPFL